MFIKRIRMLKEFFVIFHPFDFTVIFFLIRRRNFYKRLLFYFNSPFAMVSAVLISVINYLYSSQTISIISRLIGCWHILVNVEIDAGTGVINIFCADNLYFLTTVPTGFV